MVAVLTPVSVHQRLALISLRLSRMFAAAEVVRRLLSLMIDVCGPRSEVEEVLVLCTIRRYNPVTSQHSISAVDQFKEN